MSMRETALGFEIQLPDALVFFGKRDASVLHLQQRYSSLRWARVRQTHSDIVVPSSSPSAEPLTEADAHFSGTPELALLISTADCVPIMLHDPRRKIVAGIHAGWRGVASRLLPRTIERLVREGSEPADLRAFIGPHIQFPSFEVADEVAGQLIRSCRDFPESARRSLRAGQQLIDLNAIVRRQLAECAVNPATTVDLGFDTRTDERFHSHRRDREQSGRQMSFIALAKTD
ncbi:MAG: polyphenol oxidase family protein [Bdellovibrionaceae bacterium]|nr:polyphenol oxidase family protein [Pseudobdellovibrionaceae bacterium]